VGSLRFTGPLAASLAAAALRTRPLGTWLVCFVAFSSSAVLSRAELKWNQRTVEVTPGAPGEYTVAEFTFTNRGKAAVTLRDIQPDCSCVTAPLRKTTYQPGESGTITAAVAGTDERRERHIPIRLRYEEAGRTFDDLVVVNLRIPDAIRFSEEYVYWSGGEPRAPKTVSLAAAANARLQIQGVECSNPKFSAALQKTEGEGYRLQITPPKDPGRAATDVFVLAVADGETSPRRYKIVGRVIP
jgi:Protein of unknown function (DUF1573)